ncbi:MAG TPA: hypothetical protein GX405_07040 [Rhizobiales bacterium]|nr:hypothetical protein [Hyphomicrobiales bacterium]
MKLSPALSTSLHGALAPVLPRVLALRLSAIARAPIRIGDSGERGSTTLVIEKTARGRLAASLDMAALASDRRVFSGLWRRAGVFVDLLRHPSIAPGAYRCDYNDMAREAGPVLAFCSNLPGTILVPDRGFYAKRGYAAERTRAASAPAWESRDPVVLWRGNHSGAGRVLTETMSPQDGELIQRARMCLLARDIPGTDISFAVGPRWPAPIAERYRAEGIAAGFVDESAWLGRKFAIDVDGNANAFSNLFIRMLYGCCVIKIASPLGFRQWYYEDLVPWTHFVPVAADLSDLAEKIRWCRDNDEACRAIAANGKAFAEARTFERERRATVERIRKVFSAWPAGLPAGSGRDGPGNSLTTRDRA